MTRFYCSSRRLRSPQEPLTLKRPEGRACPSHILCSSLDISQRSEAVWMWEGRVRRRVGRAAKALTGILQNEAPLSWVSLRRQNHTPGKVTLPGTEETGKPIEAPITLKCSAPDCLPKREMGGVAGEACLSSEASRESVVNNIQPTIISDMQSQGNMNKRKIHY